MLDGQSMVTVFELILLFLFERAPGDPICDQLPTEYYISTKESQVCKRSDKKLS